LRFWAIYRSGVPRATRGADSDGSGTPLLQGIFETVAALLDSNDETLMFPADSVEKALRDVIGLTPETETDALLKSNNELLKQLIVEVRKILKEMETMNEMTRKRLPYKWIPGESNQDDKNM